MIHSIYLSLCVALGISFYTCYLLAPVGKHLGLIDTPGGRKLHKGDTPLIGGIAIFLGTAFAMLTLPISLAPFRGLLAGGTLLVIIGVLDDLHEIPPYSRLIGQALASVLMVFGSHIQFSHLGDLFGSGNISLGSMAVPFSILIAIANINAMNMLDGIDGLLGALTIIILGVLGIISLMTGNVNIAIISFILVAAVAGFLFYNFPLTSHRQARIFMGDSGSMFLGFNIIWIIVTLNTASPNFVLSLPLVLWILALPVFDIINVTLRRLLLKKNPLYATRDHIHHFLQSLGFSPFQTLWILITLALVTNAVALTSIFLNISEQILFYIFVVLFLVASIYYHIKWRQLTKELNLNGS